ncbi:hypothetical protein NA57DRAFT_65412 [Rhizodiscina lignyota]|uniref:ASST-domain-containing protein n=1 Tax=Rhizodiscina lignyota TaxID=1504668 RepID=A0A9P4M8L1_9PEZI|nr:hypothetical protein NA57DRAFT_65412 [Rhizodiscina lignyota]
MSSNGARSIACLPLAFADWQFKSRPDLAPPRLNITIPVASDADKGYLFVAPFAGFPDKPGETYGPRQAAPYSFRDNGNLARWNGKDVLFSFEGDHNALHGHGHGHTTILDQHYETIRELRAGNHKLTDKHEFHVINEKTALIQIYQPVPRDLSKWELDIETGKLLFEWSSLEHVLPDEAVLPLNPGQAGSGYNSSDAWDYFHINLVDKDKHGNYLISARDACSVHKINGTSGEIIWRLDGKKSDFMLGRGVKFCFQHHARFVSYEGDEEIISLYDNSAHGTEDGRGREVHTASTSSGKIIKLNTRTWEATLVQSFYPPDGLRSKSQGGTQLLPGGNVLVNWGSEGAVTEFRADGTPIFHAYMDSGFLGEGVENYRAFKYNWIGLPNEPPAIAYLGHGNDVAAYVSWNGDTETAAWRFYSVIGDLGAREFLGEANRTSFETLLSLKGLRVEKIVADALSADWKVLATTGIATLEQDVEPPRRRLRAVSV